MTTILAGPRGGVRSRLSAADADCVVLCGGLGTRLASAVPDLPKCLADVAGRPFVEWVLLALRRRGVTDALLATGHRAEQVEDRLTDGGHLGMRLRYSREPEPLGTAGALRRALPQLTRDQVLVVNGDTHCDADLAALLEAHRAGGALVTLLATTVPERSRFGALQVRDDGGVTGFGEKSLDGPGVVSAGVAVVERSLITDLPRHTRLDLESDVLPRLGPSALRAHLTDATFLDMGTPASLSTAPEAMRRWHRDTSLQDRAAAARHVQAHLDETAQAMHRVAQRCSASVVEAAALLSSAFSDGGKVLLCGNGGSAADCQHMAAELTSRLDRDFDRAALPALALTTDTSFLTAFANDVGFDGVFARQVEALGRPRDVLVAISTSGASRNVGAAVEAAHRRHMRVVGIFGGTAPLASLVDVPVVIPHHGTATVQECMLAVEHAVCEVVERLLYGPAAPAARIAGGDA